VGFGVFLSQSFCLILFIIILGNFGFGIDEHIDLGIKYDTNTGIFGMDFYVVLCRAGKRVAKRRARTSRFGKFQRVSDEDAKQWFVEKYGGNVFN
jgi:large subunit ribosomal protein L11e